MFFSILIQNMLANDRFASLVGFSKLILHIAFSEVHMGMTPPRFHLSMGMTPPSFQSAWGAARTPYKFLSVSRFLMASSIMTQNILVDVLFASLLGLF